MRVGIGKSLFFWLVVIIVVTGVLPIIGEPVTKTLINIASLVNTTLVVILVSTSLSYSRLNKLVDQSNFNMTLWVLSCCGVYYALITHIAYGFKDWTLIPFSINVSIASITTVGVIMMFLIGPEETRQDY